MRYDGEIHLGERVIRAGEPTYFIADIAANHDGDLERAKALVSLAHEAGADAAKFQHFLAKDIVSDHGFRSLGGQLAHQETWTKSVYEVYEQYQLNREWTASLAATCQEIGIEFMSTPYDFSAVDELDPLVRAYKVGSGDITWTQEIEYMAGKGKPIFLATGASDITDVQRAVVAVLNHNPQLALLQCNTNYTGDLDNFRHINLNVLRSFATMYPGMPLGLSDHTPGHATVLGAVALGACVVEKHFTDDNLRDGPDHPFSMTPITWSEMVARTRELEAAMGDGIKRIEDNEHGGLLVQRRCLRLRAAAAPGTVLTADMLEALRPAPAGSVAPFAQDDVIGRTLAGAKDAGEALLWEDLG